MAKKIVKKIKKVTKTLKAKKPKKKLVSKKQVAKKPKPLIRKAEGKLAGKVKHFFSNIKVAVIKVTSPLKVGDQIRIIGGEDTNFTQVIKSMQFDHKELKMAKKGKEIGMKVAKKVREGYKVYKI
jgi:hypothetical protein